MRIKSIKFNDDEFKKVTEIVGDEKFSTFVKVNIFKLKKDNRRLKVARAMAQAYSELIVEIKRVGNNLNQIAMRCNEKKSVDYLVLKQIELIKEQLKDIKW